MSTDADIQHKPTFKGDSTSAFENGERVPVVWPDDSKESDEIRQRADTSAALSDFISLLTSNSSVLQTGQRMHVLAYWMGVSDCKTKVELAGRLKVHPSRVSQIIRDFPSELSALSNLKSRTAKAQGICG